MSIRLPSSPHALLCLGLVATACSDDGTASTTAGSSSTGVVASTTDNPTTATPTSDPSTTDVPTGGSMGGTEGTTEITTAGPTSDPSTGTTMGVVTQTTGGDTTSIGDTTAGSTGSTGGPPCEAGTIICEGDIAKTCDGMGGFTDETPCDSGCAPDLGCLLCVPNEATCEGEISKVCNAEGTGEEEVFCDGVQGVTCDQNSGQCVGACAPKSLGTSYIGCDYYPTVTANIVAANFNFAVTVANTTDNNAKIVIEKNGQVVKNDMVGPQSVKAITLPWDLTLKSVQNPPASINVKGGAYRLRSDQPVTVYQYNPLEYQLNGGNSFTNDASLLLPVNVWSGDYFVVARNTWDAVNFGTRISGFYAVTASENGTTVTLSPSETGKLVKAGGGVQADGTGMIMLNRGDVLEVFSAEVPGNPSTADVTGTRVKADKPIQVIGGHICSFVPFDVGYCDHLEESMFPYETLAKKYIVTPPLIPTGGNVPKNQMVRIVATEDDTNLTYDPPQGAPANIAKAGQYIEILQTKADFEVTSDKKIIIAQTMLGQDAGGNSGDPAMALSVATEQFRKTYLFHAPINYETNYVNIVAPMAAKVTLDAVAVGGFAAIGATGFGVARVKLGNNIDGNHDVKSDLPVGISVYGYGQYTSYWYPGGLDLETLPQ